MKSILGCTVNLCRIEMHGHAHNKFEVHVIVASDKNNIFTGNHKKLFSTLVAESSYPSISI